MKIRFLNKILILVVIISSVWFTIVSNSDLYGSLIKLTVIPVVLLPTIINKLFSVKINGFIEFIYIVFIFLAHFLGSIVNLYDKISWYDTFVHLLSGILVAFITTYLTVLWKKYDHKNKVFNILLILGASFMIAGLWEIFEFISDKLFSKDAQNVVTTGVDDTMKDMIVAIAGTLIYCIFYLYEEFKQKKIIVTKFIESI